MASGPVDVPAEILGAMQRPVVSHYDPFFLDLFADTCNKMQQIYATEHDIVLMQGEAVLGLEAAAASLIRPGTKVLNLVSGVFGAFYADYVRRYGGELIEIVVPMNAAIDPDDVRRVLDADPGIEVLSVVHSETPSGTINPIGEICQIAHERGVVSVVDTVSGLGSDPIYVDGWGIDIAVCGPQKCLSGVPGMSLMAVSPRAWEMMESRTDPLRGSFLSILDWKTAWLEHHRFPYTPSVSDVYALHAALSLALEEGIDHMIERHRACARATRAAVRALGLDLWPTSDDLAGSCCTAITTPEGLSDADIRTVLRDRYGVMISGGVAELSGKVFRLGHMGYEAHPTSVIAELGMFERTLADLGWQFTLGSGVTAALESFAGWDDSERIA